MVFGKLFGWGKKDDGGQSTAPPKVPAGWLATLDPAWRQVLREIDKHPDLVPAKPLIVKALYKRDLEQARQVLQAVVLPRLSASEAERLKHAGAHEAWASYTDLKAAGIIQDSSKLPKDELGIGWYGTGPDNYATLHFTGEGHLLTVAPTGAGKGQRYIIPNLLEYEGPVVVFDPKGENYKATAWRRQLYGRVFKWAPFDDDTDCYNPLDQIADWDDARLVAQLMIETKSRDPFWDDSARNLLTGLIFHVMETRPPSKRNLREVHRCLGQGVEGFERLLDALKASETEQLREMGHKLEMMPENTRQSVMSALDTQLAVWSSKNVTRATSASTTRFNMMKILGEDHEGAIRAARAGRRPGRYRDGKDMVDGHAATVYLVMPTEHIASHRSVLRVMIGQLLSAAIRERKELERDREMTGEALGWPKTMEHWPLLFILDELPQLGYMEIIENAIAIARGYNIRLWLFVQDMAQLQEVYPKARSIAANCRCKMYFRINDTETATEVSERLGRRKDIWGGEDWVAAPARLMSTEHLDDAIIFMDGLNIRSMMPPIVAADPEWTAWIAHEKKVWGEEVLRQPPPESYDDGDSDAPQDDTAPVTGAPSPHAMTPSATDADLAQNVEYQRRLAELQAEMRGRRNGAQVEGASGAPKRGPLPPGFDD